MLLQLLLALSAGLAFCSPAVAAPTVKLDSATITGTTSGRVSKFLGIPFAKPPIGDLRFCLPQPVSAYTTSFSATAFGPSCPQQASSLTIPAGLDEEAVRYIEEDSAYGYNFSSDENEDCLTLDLLVPAGIPAGTKVPVVAWIFGGGFETGATSLYDGTVLVERSIDLGTPIIYVSMNYRLSAFGFLASKEVKDAGVGNLGLHDQREALRWIQKYIGTFGGDPTKVTIWGESAGGISVALHMLANNGNSEGLFRAGFMQSGSAIPVGEFTNGQKEYDAMVSKTGCAGSLNTLACLRAVPYAKLKAAVDQIPDIWAYKSLRMTWLPKADGVFLLDQPQRLVQQAKVANIPFVIGDVDDEGTVFALSTLNITTDGDLKTYLKTVFLPGISDADVNSIADLYPNNISAGSPFDTGILNALTPQFKRIAAFNGDAVFQAPRRFFLQNLASRQNAWAFLSKRLKSLPVLGSVHGSDVLNIFGGGELQDYLIRFVVTVNPNGGGAYNWPKYTTQSPQLITFLDGLFPLTTIQDTYRASAMTFLTNLMIAHPM